MNLVRQFKRSFEIKDVHVEIFCPIQLAPFLFNKIDADIFFFFLFLMLLLIFDFCFQGHHLVSKTWLGKMAVFLKNSFNGGVPCEHLLVVAPALLGIFSQDVVIHQYIHLDLLFLLKR